MDCSFRTCGDCAFAGAAARRLRRAALSPVLSRSQIGPDRRPRPVGIDLCIVHPPHPSEKSAIRDEAASGRFEKLRQSFTKDLARCVILEHFSGRIVQSVNNVIELFLGNVSEICPFREVSPKQSVGVFVGSPLPGTVRVGKIRPNTQLLLQLRMEIVLTPIVQCCRLARLLGRLAKIQSWARQVSFARMWGTGWAKS